MPLLFRRLSGSEKSLWGVGLALPLAPLRPGSFGAGVLGDGLGALRHSVLGQLPWKQQTHSCLDFPGRQRGSARVLGQPGGLSGQPLKHIVHEGIHDVHGLGGNADVGVHLEKQQDQSVNTGTLPQAPAPSWGLQGPLTSLFPEAERHGDRDLFFYYYIQAKKKNFSQLQEISNATSHFSFTAFAECSTVWTDRSLCYTFLSEWTLRGCVLLLHCIIINVFEQLCEHNEGYS